jgi:NAD(P)-dependent dehydrogenase (short-subunit alcohol dehydrogenase family)
MNGLQGKTAVVAGGGRGIGRAIAEKLAAYGSKVVIGSRTEGERRAVAEAIRGGGGTAHDAELDVTNQESVREFIREAQGHFERIDIFVYCAGINRRMPAGEYAEEAWDEVIGVNLKGAFLTCREAGERMIADGGGGSIVTITSMLSHIATPNQSAYTASKGGLLQYSKVLAVEWAKYGIRVNSVSPGYIETDLNSHNFRRQEFRDVVLGKTPMARFGESAEVAEAVCFLASPAASFITGACIPVDGGFLAGHPGIVMV